MTTQKHINYQIKLLKDYTDLNLKDDILTELSENNHRLSVVYDDQTMDDITPRINGNKEFFIIVNSMVKLFEEVIKNK